MLNTKIKPLPVREKHTISLELLNNLNERLPSGITNPNQWVTIQDNITNENLVTGNIVHYSIETNLLVIRLFYRAEQRYEQYNLNEVNIIVRGEVI